MNTLLKLNLKLFKNITSSLDGKMTEKENLFDLSGKFIEGKLQKPYDVFESFLL